MRRIVNTFGAIGYTLLWFSYVIVLGVGVMWLAQGGHLEIIGVSPVEKPVQIVEGDIVQPSLAWQIVSYSITLIMMGVVLFVMIALPYWLGRSGSRLLKRAIRYCRYPVTLKALLLGKFLACGVVMAPIVIGGVYAGADMIVTMVLLAVVMLALVVFAIQHYLATMSEVVVAKDVW